MKLAAVLSLVLSVLASGQESPKPTLPAELDLKGANRGSVSIDAKETMSGKISSNNFKSDYGSYDKDQLRTRRIAVTVRNFSRMPVNVAVETLWFVTPERPPKERVGQDLASIGERAFLSEQELKAGQSVTLEASNSAKSNRTRYEALGESYASGVKFAGWIVLARAEGKVIAYKASTPALDRMMSAAPENGLNKALVDYAKDKN